MILVLPSDWWSPTVAPSSEHQFENPLQICLFFLTKIKRSKVQKVSNENKFQNDIEGEKM